MPSVVLPLLFLIFVAHGNDDDEDQSSEEMLHVRHAGGNGSFEGPYYHCIDLHKLWLLDDCIIFPPWT